MATRYFARKTDTVASLIEFTGTNLEEINTLLATWEYSGIYQYKLTADPESPYLSAIPEGQDPSNYTISLLANSNRFNIGDFVGLYTDGTFLVEPLEGFHENRWKEIA